MTSRGCGDLFPSLTQASISSDTKAAHPLKAMQKADEPEIEDAVLAKYVHGGYSVGNMEVAGNRS